MLVPEIAYLGCITRLGLVAGFFAGFTLGNGVAAIIEKQSKDA